jgi:CBS domain-containing protein
VRKPRPWCLLAAQTSYFFFKQGGCDMNKAMAMCRGAAIGAGLMYFFDPRQGARRRALLRDAFTRLSNETCHAADVATRDLANRWQGLKSEVSSYFSGEEGQVGDDQLVARIRSHLGRACSHPRAIEVSAHEGRVTLRGPVLAAEAQHVFDCVRGTRGVKHVDNQLEQHQHAGTISALQGGCSRAGAQWDLLQSRWSPATRLLVGASAASLLACGSARGLLAGTLGALGLGMVSGSGSQLAGSHGGSASRRKAAPAGATRVPSRRSMEIGGLSDRDQYEFGEERNSMKVSNIMTPSPATCHRGTKLQEVAKLMRDCDCGAIPVVEEGTNHPVGIVTDRDITLRAIGDGRNPLDLTAADCMSTPVETISSEATLDQCLDKMESSQVRRMVVVDQDGRIAGVIAQADIAMYAPVEETAELVHDISTPAPAPTI